MRQFPRPAFDWRHLPIYRMNQMNIVGRQAAAQTTASDGLARSFFFLLHGFVSTRYQNVELVFIAHHTEAKEVTEEEFFHKGESGKTFISSGYAKALEGQDRLVLSWELSEPPGGGGGPGEFVDETEPNDFDNPDTLEIAQTARGAIDPDTDEDVWGFEGTAGQPIVIDVEAANWTMVRRSVSLKI